ncbi:major facilitator superfamily domain-containing protein, partial [Diaporthe sp. PMI_573]
VSLILASCATSPWQIVLTQGVLFGVGGIMLNFVHVSIFSEWFVERRPSAMSFIWLGWRVGSLGFPLVSQWLLDAQGYEATLQSLAVPILALLLPSLIAFRGQYPAAHVQSAKQIPRISTWRLLQTPNLLYYLLVTVLFSMVIKAPTMFIITFAEDLSLNPADQALAYCLRVISAMMGIYAFGKYSDKGLYQQLMTFSTIAFSTVYFLIWGFAKDRLTLYTFAMAIGLTSGG